MTTDTRHENLHAMKTLRFLLPLLLLPALFAACSGGNSPVQRETAAIDTVFTQARIRSYGRYYKGLELKVVSLDLYSEGLRPQPDSTHNSGTSLRFSDLFIDTTDTRLPEAMYVIDSVPALHSALPALYFDGQLTGACLLQVIDGQLQQINTFSAGSFSLRYEGDTAVMDFRLVSAASRTYHGVYRGVPAYD